MISQTQLTIQDKTQQIISMIRQSEIMKQYVDAKQKLNHHADAQALMFVARARRNAYSQTTLRLGYEHPQSIRVKQELDETLSKLADIPLIEQYEQSQQELNELIQGVTKLLMAYLSPDISLELYDEHATNGCGGGGCGSGHCDHH